MSKTTSSLPSNVIAARHEFETVFGNLARGKRNWQIMAFGAMALLGVREVAYQRYAAGSKITPYVVEIDQFGRAQSFGPVEPLKSTDRRVIIAELASFIRNLRTVVPDLVAQAELSRRAYAFATPAAASFLNSYFSTSNNDPRVIGKTTARSVEIQSVLQVPGTDTWKISWLEMERSLTGTSSEQSSSWEAYIATTLIPPTSTETIEMNPLGLYITSITWTRITRRDSIRGVMP